jgi:paraquat-inducible protein B
MNQRSEDDFPSARIERSRLTWLIWLLPVAAAIFVGWLVYVNIIGAGPTIHVIFNDAEGLEPGNSAVKFRGAVIGRVKSIQITDDQKSVDVEISVQKSSEKIAREQSEFWIVKPEVSAGEIRGLRTIVSGSYIGVKPGGGKDQTRFIGVPEPAAAALRSNGKTFDLLNANLGSVKKGTPVLFRGIQVGEVVSSVLGDKAQLVHIRIHVREEYAPLVRLNSKFWNAGGVNVDIGFTGVDISAESFKSLVGGAISFATPDKPGPVAPPLTAFRLYEKPEEAWLKWLPEIPLEQGEGTISASPESK